jgi:hypothetical protein
VETGGTISEVRPALAWPSAMSKRWADSFAGNVALNASLSFEWELSQRARGAGKDLTVDHKMEDKPLRREKVVPNTSRYNMLPSRETDHNIAWPGDG